MTTIMRNISWSFGNKKYNSYESFLAEINESNNIEGQHNSWNPEQEISKKPIRVVYEAMWKDEDNTISVDIGAENQSLTMGQILFILNNATYDFFRRCRSSFL